MAKIEELTEKYKNDSVKDSHYQEYAKTACLAQIKSHQPLVDEFQEIATRLDASISQLNRVQFEQTHARVLACVNSYPDHLAFHIKKISHQIADKKIAPLINATHKSDMKLRISSEVFKLVDVLKQKACGQGFEPIQSLRDLIGLSRFHNSNETMMQKVEAYLEGREDLCKGAFL